VFDTHKTRITGLPIGEKNYNNIFPQNTGVWRIDRQTDRQTDRIAISLSRVSVLMRDKNELLQNQFTVYRMQ